MATAYAASRRVERWYAVALRAIARHIDALIRAYGPDPAQSIELEQTLDAYAETLRPWARAVGARMVEDVRRDSFRTWMGRSQTIGRELRREMAEDATGAAMRASQERQVALITSLPREAGLRVQRLAREAVAGGARIDELKAEILRTGSVTASRATLIARTEVARANTELTKARAESIGSTGYIWRTSEDSDVRPSHRALAGRFVRWDSPPVTDGLSGHAGCVPNCRCYAEPVLPDSN